MQDKELNQDLPIICLLDPNEIRASRWMNRHESTFATHEFLKLKQEIQNAGKNIQPIKVRPVLEGGYEIVFGHRRHRACLESGIPVWAIIESCTDDRQLWEEMDRENRGRQDLTPYERGVQYKKALEQGLYPSTRRMAQAIDVDVSLATKLVKFAKLPDEVITAFRSPNEIHVNWVGKLCDSVDRDREGLIRRAAAARDLSDTERTGKAVFAALTGQEGVEPFHAETLKISDARGAQIALIKRDKAGISIEIKRSDIPLAQLQAALQPLLSESNGRGPALGDKISARTRPTDPWMRANSPATNQPNQETP